MGSYGSQAFLKFSLIFLSLLHIHVVTKPQGEDLGESYLAAYPRLRMTTTKAESQDELWTFTSRWSHRVTHLLEE